MIYEVRRAKMKSADEIKAVAEEYTGISCDLMTVFEYETHVVFCFFKNGKQKSISVSRSDGFVMPIP